MLCVEREKGKRAHLALPPISTPKCLAGSRPGGNFRNATTTMTQNYSLPFHPFDWLFLGGRASTYSMNAAKKEKVFFLRRTGVSGENDFYGHRGENTQCTDKAKRKGFFPKLDNIIPLHWRREDFVSLSQEEERGRGGEGRKRSNMGKLLLSTPYTVCQSVPLQGCCSF